MWLLWLRGSESMFPVKLRSSLAFFKTHCWPSTCLFSHQTSQRFIFSCFYSLCNLNVFGFWIVDSKGRALYVDPWLVGILAPCSSRSCKSHLGMLHRWPLNIKQQVYDQNWGKSFFFYWSKPMSTIRRNCFAKRIVAKVVATVSPRLLETSFMAKHLSDLSSLLVNKRNSISKHEYLRFQTTGFGWWNGFLILLSSKTPCIKLDCLPWTQSQLSCGFS